MDMLINIFPGLVINEEFKEVLSKIAIQKMDYYKTTQTLIIYIESDTEIPFEVIENLENQINKTMNLSYTEIVLSVNNNLLDIKNVDIEAYKNKVIKAINQRYPVTKAILQNSNWQIDDKEINIKLEGEGKDILEAKKCNNSITKFFKRNFGVSLKVNFEEGIENKEDKAKQLEEKMKATEQEIIKAVMQGANKKETKVDDKGKPAGGDSGEDSPVIMGKLIKDPPMKIRDVSEELDKVILNGEVISVDSRELKSGKMLLSADIYDGTSSITVKAFLQKENFPSVSKKIKEGSNILIQGKAQYDTYAKEVSVLANHINVGTPRPIRMDNSEEKRVELHLHTQMSAMDGVSSPTALVSRASKWGHKAIAITDHGVLQGYPEAYSAGKKNNIKIIYGVEGYITNLPDIPETQDKSKFYSIDGEFVVFDIETTGFSPKDDRITEIGAVRIRNNEIVETFNELINPEMNIPKRVSELTGITNEMVKDCETIKEILPKFIEFVGDVPVMGHNAKKFDILFIKENARKLKMKFDNMVVDTLDVARYLLKTPENHKLGTLVRYFGIKAQVFHRASDDATYTAEVWFKLVQMLKERDLNTIEEIDWELETIEKLKEYQSYHVSILVKNKTGLMNLYRLVSEAHLNYFYKKPRIPKKLLEKFREGLLVGTACNVGELYTALFENKSEEEIDALAKFYDYYEIMPLGNNEHYIRRGLADKEKLIEINKKIVALGEKYGKMVVATGDVHFLDPEDEVYRRILMASQGFDDADEQAPLYLKTTGEMLEEFSYLGEDKAKEVVVTNPNAIADMVEAGLQPIPEETFPPHIDGAEEQLEEMTWKRAKELYGDPLPTLVKERMEKELNSIIKNGFSVLYIIAQKLVHKSVSDGYLVGSRGSVGSSFVAYLAGITEVNALPAHYRCPKCKYSEFPENNPHDCGVDMEDKKCPKCGEQLIKAGYDIPFEVFLGFNGDKDPDIDLNFSGSYQPQIHKYTEELLGEGHVFKAGTIGTIADKTAYGFVKGYITDKNIRMSNAEINRLSKGCQGVKRTTGQHPGGLIIVPQGHQVYEFCPIQRPADDNRSNIVTTHFDYHAIHGTLLKLDELGHDDPTVIRMLQDLTGIDPKTIPLDDKDTMEIFHSLKSLGLTEEQINCPIGTFGVPEFGTKFVRQMLIDTKPTTMSELLKISGLSHGTDVWLNNAQTVIQKGLATLSEVICTRDDIMLGLIKMGLPPKLSFDTMEGVRKGKGLKPEQEEAMMEHDVPQWYIDSCKKIKYMFPKAHAAAYVMMAFRIAYFKVHYPLAYYSTYFSIRAEDFDAELILKGKEAVKAKIKEIEQMGNDASVKDKGLLTVLEIANEMYERGLQLLPIDLYKSDSVKFLIEGDKIRPPFNSIQGVGETVSKAIVEAREDEKFFSKDDLKLRGKVNKSVMDILDRTGVLKDLPDSAQMSLFG